MRVALHTIFIARENLPFLEEWIRYCLAIGVDYLYLQDNSKVGGYSAYSSQHGKARGMIPGVINKNGFNFRWMVPLSDEAVTRTLKQVEQKYAPRVKVVEWSPTDSNGVVQHNQEDGRQVACRHLRELGYDWALNLDMDEFLVCRGFDVKAMLRKIPEDVSAAYISQKPYLARWLSLGTMVTGITTYSKKPLPFTSGQKYIYRPSRTGSASTHSCTLTSGKGVRLPSATCHFNHYNRVRIEDPGDLREYSNDILQAVKTAPLVPVPTRPMPDTGISCAAVVASSKVAPSELLHCLRQFVDITVPVLPTPKRGHVFEALALAKAVECVLRTIASRGSDARAAILCHDAVAVDPQSLRFHLSRREWKRGLLLSHRGSTINFLVDGHGASEFADIIKRHIAAEASTLRQGGWTSCWSARNFLQPPVDWCTATNLYRK